MNIKIALSILALLFLGAQSQAPNPLQQLQQTFNGLYANLSLSSPVYLEACFTLQTSQYFFNFMSDLLSRSQALALGNKTGFAYYDQELQADLLDLGPTLPCIFGSSDTTRLFNYIGLTTNFTALTPQLALFVDGFAVELTSFLTAYMSYRSLGYYANSGAILGPLVRLLPSQTNSFLYSSLSAFYLGLFTSVNASFSTGLACLSIDNSYISSALQFYNNWGVAASNSPLGNVSNATNNYFNGNGYVYYNNAIGLFNCIGSSLSNSYFASSTGFGVNFYANGNKFSSYLNTYLGYGAVNWYTYQNQMKRVSFYFLNNQTRLAGETLGNFFLSL